MIDSLQYDPQTNRFVLKPPPKAANAFEWQKYVAEEDQRRSGRSLAADGVTSRKRSISSTKAIERIRTTEPAYGTVGINTKTSLMIELKPKTFNVYSQAQVKSKGRGER